MHFLELQNTLLWSERLAGLSYGAEALLLVLTAKILF